jgi:hypothetical protein
MTRAMFFKRSVVFVGRVMVLGALATSMTAAPQTGRTASTYTVHTSALPDNGTGDVSMDYIAFDRTTNSLWVPGGIPARWMSSMWRLARFDRFPTWRPRRSRLAVGRECSGHPL